MDVRTEILQSFIRDMADMGIDSNLTELLHDAQTIELLYRSLCKIDLTSKDPYIDEVHNLIYDRIIKNPAIETYMLFSVKHTHQGDDYLTFWRHNNSGYCYFREWSGIYTASDNLFASQTVYKTGKGLKRDDSKVMVPTSILEPLWRQVEYDGVLRWVIPLTRYNVKQMGLYYTNLHTHYKKRR